MRISFLMTFLIGTITPFIPSFIMIEMFFLLIPFGIVFIGTLIYLIMSFFHNAIYSRKAIFIFSFLPIFILSQVLSALTVNGTQKYLSEIHINDLHKIKKEKGIYPTDYESSIGIKYKYLAIENEFILEYSRGFMIIEKYDSKQEKWGSCGWND